MQGEDNQSNYVTRWHAKTPLVVRLLGTHEAQGAVVAVFGVEVKGHRYTEEAMEIFTRVIPSVLITLASTNRWVTN